MGGAVSIVVFILIVLILACIALIVASLVRPKLNEEDVPPCERVDMFTAKEQAFFTDLQDVCEKIGLLPFAKVGLGCILKPKKNVTSRDKWGRMLRGEYADFVLCDPNDLRIALVIMLEESTVSLQKTQVSVVDRTCSDASIPMLHVREYNLAGLEKAIRQKTSAPPRRKTPGAASDPISGVETESPEHAEIGA